MSDFRVPIRPTWFKVWFSIGSSVPVFLTDILSDSVEVVNGIAITVWKVFFHYYAAYNVLIDSDSIEVVHGIAITVWKIFFFFHFSLMMFQLIYCCRYSTDILIQEDINSLIDNSKLTPYWD